MALGCKDSVEDTCYRCDEEDGQRPSDHQSPCAFRNWIVDIFPEDLLRLWCFTNRDLLSSLSKKFSQLPFL